MKKLLLMFALATPALAQISNPVYQNWYSATPPTVCVGVTYQIANGYTGAGNIYGNASATPGNTSCSLLAGSSTGTGTVTSVTDSSGLFAVANPTTTPTFTYNTETANTVLAGPTTGAAAPTFRALVAADIPNNASQAGSVANAATFNNGGTGAASGTTYTGSAAQTISYNTLGAAGLAANNTLSGNNTLSAAPTASVPGNYFSGSPLTSGTIQPVALIGNGAAPTYNAGGEMLAINPATGYSGDLIDAFVGGGASKFSVTSGGSVNASGAITANTAFDSNLARTTITGTTAGTALWSQPFRGTAYSLVMVYLNGYENTTATAQTFNLTTAMATVNYVVTLGGSCTGLTASLSVVTLPSSQGAPITGLCEVIGF
jgi:hypothetical protein